MFAAACGDDAGRATATMTDPTSLTNVVFTTGIAGTGSTTEPSEPTVATTVGVTDGFTTRVRRCDLVSTLNAVVTVDGNPVAGWQPLGASNYQVAHVKLDSSGNGNHSVVGDVGVGVAVSGVQSSGSYWYLGGLDLDLIPQ